MQILIKGKYLQLFILQQLIIISECNLTVYQFLLLQMKVADLTNKCRFKEIIIFRKIIVQFSSFEMN